MIWEETQKGSANGFIGRTVLEPPNSPAKIGLCFPDWLNQPHLSLAPFADLLAQLMDQDLSFKLMSEESLTLEWEGLDLILYSPEALSQEGQRKLKGFCAAGGEVRPVPCDCKGFPLPFLNL